MIWTMVLGFLQKNAVNLIIYAAIAGVGVYVWNDYQTAKTQLAATEVKLETQIKETRKANTAAATVVKAHNKLVEENKALERKRKESRIAASARERALRNALAHSLSSGDISPINDRLCLILQRIQRGSFRGIEVGEAAESTIPAYYGACGLPAALKQSPEKVMENILINFDRIASYVEEVEALR